ncbi:MAG: membrane protein [Cyclobacteriaceae bacterium]|nr:MAG: membrane protein [Cyclobacteriaceae bacterium]
MRPAISFLLVFAAGLIRAQDCSLTLSGMVQSDEGERLAGAVIRLTGGPVGAAGNNGEFSFYPLCPGRYGLTVQFVGYDTFSEEITLLRDTVVHIRLKTAKTVLSEVVVHGHFDNELRYGNRQLVSGQQLEANRDRPLGEMLRQAAGLGVLQTGPSVFKPVVHGLHSQRLLLINNGVRHESQQWGAEHAPEIDPNTADNVVIVKDASALKYGPEALGGVLLINPAPLPEDGSWGGEVFSHLQSNGRGGTLALLAEGASRKLQGLGWRAQTSMKRLGDFESPRYVLSNTGVSELNFSLATGLHRSRLGWDAFFSHFQTELGILRGTSVSSLEDLRTAMTREPPQYTDAFTYAIQNPRQQTRHNLLKLQAHRHIHQGDLQVQYAFQQNNRKEFDLRRQPLNDFPALHLDLLTHTLDASWQQHTRQPAQWQGGINLIYQSNNNVAGTQRIPFIPNFVQLGSGVFLALGYQLNNWTLSGTARYDYRYYEVAGFDFANRRYADRFAIQGVAAAAGIHYQANPSLHIVSTVGSAWRPPHVSELYSAGVHQSAAAIEYGLLLNQTTNEVMPFDGMHFKPERAWKWTNTLSWQKKNWQADVTGYGNFISHFTYLRPEGITRNIRGIYPYLRYDRTNALFTGLDLHAAYHFAPGFSANAQVALLRAEDVTRSDYLIYIPPNRYSFFLTGQSNSQNRKAQFSARLSVTFTDRQRRAPRVITVEQLLDAYEQGNDPLQGNPAIFDFMPAPQGYVLLGLETGCTFRPDGKKMSIRLRADNLLNHAYRDYTDRMRYYALEAGRNISLSVQYSF